MIEHCRTLFTVNGLSGYHLVVVLHGISGCDIYQWLGILCVK